MCRAFPVGAIRQSSVFPKFWALKQYLELKGPSLRPEGFHCIVFAETRTGEYR